MTEAPVRFEIDGAVGVLLLDDPPKNEMSLAFFDALARVFEVELRPGRVKGWVITGAGRHFSSGANVPELAAELAKPHGMDRVRQNHELFAAIESAPFPVVAAVRGTCFGVGLELALACHYRIAANRAVFALPEIEFGLVPGCGGTFRLPRTVGAGRAIEMILSGRALLADEADRAGLVDLVVDRKDLLNAAKTAVERLAVTEDRTGR